MTASAARGNIPEDPGESACSKEGGAFLLPVVCMAVLTEELKGQLKEFFAELSDFPVDEVLLQDMIVLNGREIGEYKAVMEREFSIEAEAVESWRQSGEGGFGDGEGRIPPGGARTHAFKVRYLPHVRSGEIVRPCLSPMASSPYYVEQGRHRFVLILPTFHGECAGTAA